MGPEENKTVVRRFVEELLQLSTVSTNDVSPSWSPDGSRIAFESDRRGYSPGSSIGRSEIRAAISRTDQPGRGTPRRRVRNPRVRWSESVGTRCLSQRHRSSFSDTHAVDVGLLAGRASQSAVSVGSGVQVVRVVLVGDRAADRTLPAVCGLPTSWAGS